MADCLDLHAVEEFSSGEDDCPADSINSVWSPPKTIIVKFWALNKTKRLNVMNLVSHLASLKLGVIGLYSKVNQLNSHFVEAVINPELKVFFRNLLNERQANVRLSHSKTENVLHYCKGKFIMAVDGEIYKLAIIEGVSTGMTASARGDSGPHRGLSLVSSPFDSRLCASELFLNTARLISSGPLDQPYSLNNVGCLRIDEIEHQKFVLLLNCDDIVELDGFLKNKFPSLKNGNLFPFLLSNDLLSLTERASKIAFSHSQILASNNLLCNFNSEAKAITKHVSNAGLNHAQADAAKCTSLNIGSVHQININNYFGAESSSSSESKRVKLSSRSIFDRLGPRPSAESRVRKVAPTIPEKFAPPRDLTVTVVETPLASCLKKTSASPTVLPNKPKMKSVVIKMPPKVKHI
jgi:hypothetical protein